MRERRQLHRSRATPLRPALRSVLVSLFLKEKKNAKKEKSAQRGASTASSLRESGLMNHGHAFRARSGQDPFELLDCQAPLPLLIIQARAHDA